MWDGEERSDIRAAYTWLPPVTPMIDRRIARRITLIALRWPAFDGIGKKVFFDEALEIVFQRHASGLRVCGQSGFDFGLEVQGTQSVDAVQ